MFGEVKGEKIKSAISKKLYETFKIEDINNPSTFICDKIYKEKTVQGVERPSFFIYILDVQLEKRIFDKYELAYNVVIRYEIEERDDNNYEKLNEVGNVLFCNLKTIDIEIPAYYIDENQEKQVVTMPLRGSRMEYITQDNILQFFVTYKFRVWEYKEKGQDMQVVKTNVTKKEDEK